jgi:glycosyltransferase involved in cell wall biosynthesis
MRLVYFSPISARSYEQRPHFSVRALLDRGVTRVLWVDPYPHRLPRWSDLWRHRVPRDQGTPLDSRITVLDVPALPVEPLPGGTTFNRWFLWRKAWAEIAAFAAPAPCILGIGCPGALPLAVLRHFRPAASFYDAMDNFPEFHCGLSRLAMRRHENAITALVDLVITSSTYLTDKFAQGHPCVEKILNACSTGDLPAEPPPRDHRPILGYVGCLGSWFDWPLVVRLAEAVPEVRIELIGPCETRRPRNLPPNVRLLAACPRHAIPHHLARFSAGLIPFVRNRLTAGVDPIKYYDYRAFGLPVLTTRFGEMALRGADEGVCFLDPAADLRALVQQALARPLDVESMEQFRATHNWQERFAAARLIDRLFPAPPAEKRAGAVAPQAGRAAA